MKSNHKVTFKQVMKLSMSLGIIYYYYYYYYYYFVEYGV